MSRTDKDRPYWVKQNDETLLRYIDHDHLNLGRTYYRDRIVRDENGKPVTRTVMRERRIFSWERYFSNRNGGYTVETYEAIEVVRERVENFTYADHCTGDFRTQHGRYNQHATPEPPCTPQLTLGSWYGYDKAPKSVKRGFNRTIRVAERAALREYAKGVNSNEDWDGLDDSDVELRVNAHVQDYWG
jgi:hypothetical protein